MKYSPIAALIQWYVVIYDTHLSHRPKQNGRHLYTKFSNAFIYMNIFGVYCCFSFPWRLFQGLPFTISHYWFLNWLIVEQVKVIMLTYDDSIHSLICASPSCSVLCKTQLRGINLMPTAKPFYHNISLWNLSRFANVVHNASTVPLHEPGALILCKTCVTNLFLWVCPETLQAREISFVHSIQLSNRNINSSTTMQNVKTTRVVYSKFQIKRINSSPPLSRIYTPVNHLSIGSDNGLSPIRRQAIS